MNIRNNRIIKWLCVWLATVVVFGLLIVQKFYNKIEYQYNQIQDLTGRTQYLEGKIEQISNYYEFSTEYEDDAYNYFAIGNSLTLITSYGVGICVSQPELDYFHRVTSELEETTGRVISYAYNFSAWERVSNRNKTVDLIDIYLDDRLDLVTIQLGENVTDTTTFEDDLVDLIDYVKEKAPQAQIVVVGDFWSEKKDTMRKRAAQRTDVSFADISAIVGKKEYQSKAGLECMLPDDTSYIVSEAAASHPGDLGMEYIANQILGCLN